jgi:short-subunit dehydrogenase
MLSIAAVAFLSIAADTPTPGEAATLAPDAGPAPRSSVAASGFAALRCDRTWLFSLACLAEACHRCDVAERRDLTELRDRVSEAFERCDVLVNNAGIRGGGRFETEDIEHLDRVIDVNLRGVVLATKLFLPMMLERGRGHIVNIASLAGRFATPGAAVYGATKHAVVAFSEALYHELGPRGILVTSVNPGFSPTEGFPETGPSFVRLDPDEVAKLIVDVVRKGTAPEISIPRSLAALQAFRVLTPRLYRWGVGTISRRYGSTGSAEG